MIHMEETQVQNIIQKFNIPPKPALLISLQQELARKDPDPVAYADLISQDVALSALVLKLVNSPLFGLRRDLTDIRQAVVMLGTNRLTHLISYFALQQSVKGKSAISLEKFWDNTMEVATMSRLVVEYLGSRHGIDQESLYALCLFRDCGIPLMAMKYDNYRDVLYEANHTPEQCFTEVEEKYYQTNHAIVGFYVAASWHLPKVLCELILHHHEPHFLNVNWSSEEQKDLFALMKVASAAATRYKYDKTDSEWPAVADEVLIYLGMSAHDFDDMMADLQELYVSTLGGF